MAGQPMAIPVEMIVSLTPPPLGLRPGYAHDREANVTRIREIADAIERYVRAGAQPPEAWFLEMQQRARVKE